jgi:hypothetical protein
VSFYVSALLFTGYLLVYAAIAKGGRFVLRPWDALRGSAYGADDHAGGRRTTPYDTGGDLTAAAAALGRRARLAPAGAQGPIGRPRR